MTTQLSHHHEIDRPFAAPRSICARPPDKTLLLFAGLWENWWPVKDAKPALTFTIVTGPPGIVSGDIHDRAPLILPAESWEPWLTGSPGEAKRIVATTVEPELAYHAVSKAVGAPRNDSSENIEPVDQEI